MPHHDALDAPTNHRVLTRPPTEEVETWDMAWSRSEVDDSGFWTRPRGGVEVDLRDATTFVDDDDDDGDDELTMPDAELPPPARVVCPEPRRRGLLARLFGR